MGIDPGLRYTGWGIIEAQGNRLAFVSSGTLTTDKAAALAWRLRQLHEGLSQVVERFEPEEAAVESTFVNRDAVATLKLGQARGIALLVPALADLLVAEYAPNAVKKAVTGTGHGDKHQIQMMVRTLLPKSNCDTDHAADALAVAICHANMRGARSLASEG